MEPWNIKQDDKRDFDTIPRFIIFCEDKVSEPAYFEYFETNRIKVIVHREQKSGDKNVLRAIRHCIDQGIMTASDAVAVLDPDVVQVWCVFDLDSQNCTDIDNLGNLEFDLSIERAKTKGLQTAWSNDAFELWVLLHFEDVDPTDLATQHRKYYYDRLTDIFKKLPNPNADLLRMCILDKFNYKEFLKSDKHFKSIVMHEMAHRTGEAVHRAFELQQWHDSGQAKPLHRHRPCTLVYRLVEELLRLGQKMPIQR